ncbi:MAG: RHS repeat-associated core domain-containing protein [Pseudodesulfovibrio sp.]|uniref:RHS repeat-associated core domain-containing protein n=1 Tax=Pseudodesulfovibrio sp. TaxID=2035812 RepID=UPI003D0D285B
MIQPPCQSDRAVSSYEPLGFAGGLHDRDLGFVRFGWRDYDVRTGRWTAPDPIGERGGDPDWYGYCLDDPVNGVDPLGLLTNEYGEKIPDGRILTEYVPGWDMLFGGDWDK